MTTGKLHVCHRTLESNPCLNLFAKNRFLVIDLTIFFSRLYQYVNVVEDTSRTEARERSCRRAVQLSEFRSEIPRPTSFTACIPHSAAAQCGADAMGTEREGRKPISRYRSWGREAFSALRPGGVAMCAELPRPDDFRGGLDPRALAFYGRIETKHYATTFENIVTSVLFEDTGEELLLHQQFRSVLCSFVLRRDVQASTDRCERARAGVPTRHCTINTNYYGYLLHRRWVNPRVPRARNLWWIGKFREFNDLLARLHSPVYTRDSRVCSLAADPHSSQCYYTPGSMGTRYLFSLLVCYWIRVVQGVSNELYAVEWPISFKEIKQIRDVVYSAAANATTNCGHLIIRQWSLIMSQKEIANFAVYPGAIAIALELYWRAHQRDGGAGCRHESDYAWTQAAVASRWRQRVYPRTTYHARLCNGLRAQPDYRSFAAYCVDKRAAAVAEWLVYSPPTKANRVQFPDGCSCIFACGNRATRCRGVQLIHGPIAKVTKSYECFKSTLFAKDSHMQKSGVTRIALVGDEQANRLAIVPLLPPPSRADVDNWLDNRLYAAREGCIRSVPYSARLDAQ
ncbi:hypothetical protein PR048_031372 [Dryococelus australis]|uniref:Uncharacterized protein n=1 Tax=Dryococelus australis TaxID=614101 RepID=A0ABQ9G536_9NEOP|nr:hypothetical protein PR048_031372 [Dryococelus australis]